MPRLLGSHIARSPATISDKHWLFWNSFRIPGAPPQRHNPRATPYHPKTRKVPNISKAQSTKDQYQANMQDWFATQPCPSGTQLNPDSASQYLQQVSKVSTEIGLDGIKWKYK